LPERPGPDLRQVESEESSEAQMGNLVLVQVDPAPGHVEEPGHVANPPQRLEVGGGEDLVRGEV